MTETDIVEPIDLASLVTELREYASYRPCGCDPCRGHPERDAALDGLTEILNDFAAKPSRTFQGRVGAWMDACFGPVISADKLERGDRFLEEALELLQSGGYPRERIAALTEYVWSRPAGEPAQEVGGVAVTLAAYCRSHGIDMHGAAEAELARVWTKIEAIRAKQAAKPQGSALPMVWGGSSGGPSPAPVPADKPLTALTLADALGCFWNGALGQARDQQSGYEVAAIMANGIAAVETRLRELAGGAK